MKPLFQVISIDEAAGIGLDEESDWLKLGFKNYVWKIKLHWNRSRLLFGNEWNVFATASELKHGDKCILVGTAEEERFEAAIFHKEQFNAVYKSGNFLDEIIKFKLCMPKFGFFNKCIVHFISYFKNL